ncbi:MAG: radical SAM protein [Elusimicrobia bacterium]|nr:radical SAM protein [Elusimicrobiota bacterium]MDE2236747.1 radical SAM protein [Elusimicrobiota bacterium]MDE2426926.1 radical SAM protein [Elusimicrobiota bacterium]
MTPPPGTLDIVVCTTPIRPVPSVYPPFGSLAVIQALRRRGYDPYFYDIDCLRPSFEEVERFFRERQPDVVGISAVVSTAYAYTKRLAAMLRRACPKAWIVVGGNLAASAEILHRLAGVDFCVIGEGETVGSNLIDYLSRHPKPERDEAALSAIRGLTFLRSDGELAFTGYETALPAEEVFDPDFGILKRYSRIEHFINDPLTRTDFLQDPRTRQPHRAGQRMVTLVSTKGCVARCTFCHRWDKGYRAVPVPRIIEVVRRLKREHNVGFIQFSDENFGSDRRQVDAFIEAIKQEDVLYNLGGVRVRSVDPERLKRLKDSGCVAIYYGIETGSPAILEMMEKKAALQDNINAANWTREAGLYTIYQYVLGMPGETDRTIRETIEFMKLSTEKLKSSPVELMSINYIQALPGTPVYEYARHLGLIGKSPAEEERYLELISDTNAGDETKFLNFTPHDYLTVQMWRRHMTLETVHHYRRVNKVPPPSLKDLWREIVVKSLDYDAYARSKSRYADTRNDYTKGSYFNLQTGFYYHVISAFFYPLRAPLIFLWILRQEGRRLPFRVFLGRVREHAAAKFRPAPPPIDYKSLRAIMQGLSSAPLTPTETAMAPLRAGR